MTRKEKKARIEKLIARNQALSTQLDKIADLFGNSGYESDFFSAIFGAMDDLLDATAELVGDKAGWASWYIHENDNGKSALSAGPKGKMRSIRTVADLLRLIDD